MFVNCSQFKWGALLRRCKPIKRSAGSAISAAFCGSLNSLIVLLSKSPFPSITILDGRELNQKTSTILAGKFSYVPCALCPVGGDVAKRQEYSNWRKLRVAWSKTMDGPRITKKAARCGYGVRVSLLAKSHAGGEGRDWRGMGVISVVTTGRKSHTIIQHRIREVS